MNPEDKDLMTKYYELVHSKPKEAFESLNTAAATGNLDARIRLAEHNAGRLPRKKPIRRKTT